MCSPLPFSLSLCDPRFHLTEAGNAKTKPRAQRSAEGWPNSPHPPPRLTQSLCLGDRTFSWTKSVTGGGGDAPHAALLSEAGNAVVASVPALSFFFCWKGLRQLLPIGHHGQSVAATSKQPEPLALKAESASVRGLVRHAESRFQPRPSESEPAF